MKLGERILCCLLVLLLCFQPGWFQACMQGFLGEDSLREKAVLIGRTVLRQTEQIIIPDIKFTCSGSITQWRFVAQQNRAGNQRNKYPELQIWRLQNNQVYTKVFSETLAPQSTPQDNVYAYTLSTSFSYMAGDVFGIHYPPSESSVYRIYSVEEGGPKNYRLSGSRTPRTSFDLLSSSVRSDRADYPLVGIATNRPQCVSGFLSNRVLNARGGALSGSDNYESLSNQQRLIQDLNFQCQGRIGRILVAAQNKGTGGPRDEYPEVHIMRGGVFGYYSRIAGFTLDELEDVNSPNVLEFRASGTFALTYVLPGDVIRYYQPNRGSSVYSIYHEPGRGPSNFYINDFSALTHFTFPTTQSSTDNSQPLLIIELMARCSSLPNPTNGVVQFSDSTATYSCNLGYRLVGSEYRYCNNNTAQWGGQAPTCRFIDCTNPPSLPQGSYTLSKGTGLNSVATYSCNNRYVLEGSRTRQCQMDERWSGQTPLCKRRCNAPSSPQHGRVSVGNQPIEGERASFSCNNNYELTGVSTIVCQSNGQWSPPVPTCDLIQCPPLSSPNNGLVTVNIADRTVGAIAVYECGDGYNLSGVIQRVCQQNRRWTAEDPVCQLIKCPQLSNPQNGKVQLNGKTVGRTARYSCSRGYVLQGQNRRTCQQNSYWSGHAPTCQLIDCGIPLNPSNGLVDFESGTQLDNQALYSCIDGYQLSGNQQSVCEENSQWSGELPECQVIDCGPAPVLYSGRVETNSTRVYGTAVYICNTGYRLVGRERLVCQHSGMWSASGPMCTEVDCGPLLHPQNGEVFVQSTGYNSVATYACRQGHMLQGHSERVCQENGSWSQKEPVCFKHVVSSRPPTIRDSNATFSTFEATVFPSSTEYSILSKLSDSVPENTTSPTIDNDLVPNGTGRPHINIFIICGVISFMLFLIIVLTLLIVGVYVRKKKMNALAAATANSVENPVYLGQGSTPQVNCFEVGCQNGRRKHHQTATELRTFNFTVTAVDGKQREDNLSTSTHVYDFPSEENGLSEHYEQDGRKNECPGHYHLATQYEIPVSANHQPKATTTSPIYKNTLMSDLYVPTLEERRKTVQRRKKLMQRSFTLSPAPTEEKVFFEESSTYWRPASNPAALYEQLAKNKYREICRKHVQVTELLGSGQFGMVNKGIWQRPGGATEVAIKTLREGAMEDDKVRFLQEAATSGQFQHPNVVKLQGVVTVGEPIMIILELLPNGDLRDYLTKNRPVPGEKVEEDWATLLLDISQDIASGMDYLSSKAFVHRDLAARNILVADDRTCKIGDFGMSRDLEKEDYYISNGGKIPVKWTAPEALHYKKYSGASDVWSFGVLMFELWGFGHRPFDRFSNAEAIKMVDQGLRLAPPPGCPRAIYKIMIECWHPRTSSRPTFYALLHTLTQDPTALLSWTEEDAQVHPLASTLGAPIETGLTLYIDLQQTYINSASVV